MLERTIQVSNAELAEARDPAKLVYDRLLDAGCPVAPNGSLAPDCEGFSGWWVDGSYLCFSWGTRERP